MPVQQNVNCIESVTTVNGARACKDDVIFEDSFDSYGINYGKWRHSVQISDDADNDFVIFDDQYSECYVENGKLHIKPTILHDNTVDRGNMVLKNCQKGSFSVCQKQSNYYNIIPPVRSALIYTEAFSFRYGKVTIRAKLPEGDWIVPVLQLNHKHQFYGPLYSSGSIRIAAARGNRQLTCNGWEMGNRVLNSGVIMGPNWNIRARTVSRFSNIPWSSSFHNYTLIWTPDNLSFLVDGLQKEDILPAEFYSLWGAVGFSYKDIAPSWIEGSKIAPFDQEFFLSVGLTVGGVREFLDNCTSNNYIKPWRNAEAKSLLHFWLDRSNWQPTWGSHSTLEVDSITITAL